MARNGTRGPALVRAHSAQLNGYYRTHQASTRVAPILGGPRLLVCAHLGEYCSTCRDVSNMHTTARTRWDKCSENFEFNFPDFALKIRTPRVSLKAS